VLEVLDNEVSDAIENAFIFFVPDRQIRSLSTKYYQLAYQGQDTDELPGQTDEQRVRELSRVQQS